MLTEASIRALKPRPKPFKVSDGRGLFVLVSPTGGRLWRFRYSFAGREKLISLGQYPDIGLKLARDRRDEARRLVAQGIDPSAVRREARAAQADTFEALAEEWLTKQAHLAASTIKRDRDRLVNYVLPYLGALPVRSVDAPALLAVLRRIESRGTHETAHRTRAVVGRVLRYAIAIGRAERDVSADLKGALTPSTTVNHAALTDPRRVGELLRAIGGYQGQPEVRSALQLLPHVFTRPGELRGARWCEFDLDGAEPTWRIPAERMKMRREHIVPLSRQALAILQELLPLTGRESVDALVFPGLRVKSRPISDNTLCAALRRIGFASDEQSAHGFRTIASTLLNEQGFHPDLIELQLAHAPRDEVRAAYNRAQRLSERRAMLQSWSDYLDGLKAGSDNVVTLKRARHV